MLPELKSALQKFEDTLFSANSDNDINKMNQIITLGEQLIEMGESDEYIKHIYPSSAYHISHYVAYHMLETYYQRARYYSHRGWFWREKHPKNIRQSISDYIRFIELIPIAKKLTKEEHIRVSEILGHEGLCDCYLELNQAHNAIDIANQMVRNYKDARSYLIRSKCYIEGGVLNLAHNDITYALEIAQNPNDISEALEIQNKLQKLIKENNFQPAININGNVSGSTVIAGNENKVQNKT